MDGQTGRVRKLVMAWARGWEQFMEASRGPADRLVGPPPWEQGNELRPRDRGYGC